MNKQQFIDKIHNFNPNSRVWIYQADRLLTNGKVDKIDSYIHPFAETWSHHGANLKSKAYVLYNLFIVFVVDETDAEVGGCGIDSSVHLVQKISTELQIEFFNRLAIAYFKDEKIICENKQNFSETVNSSSFNTDTLVFNNQVKTLQELKNNWIIPFNKSWHTNFFSKSDSFNLSL